MWQACGCCHRIDHSHARHNVAAHDAGAGGELEAELPPEARRLEGEELVPPVRSAVGREALGGVARLVRRVGDLCDDLLEQRGGALVRAQPGELGLEL
mgnify:CR=1 FL=1